MMLHLSTHTSGDAVIVDCIGKIVYCEEAAFLRGFVRGLLNQHHHIVLDLSGVTQIDSQCIGTMVGSWASVRNSGGDVTLAALSRRVQDALTITKLMSLFSTFETAEKAAASFAAQEKAA
jgi:anti-sigma B factor antagonist